MRAAPTLPLLVDVGTLVLAVVVVDENCFEAKLARRLERLLATALSILTAQGVP